MIQQPEKLKPLAPTLRATRELCLAEGFWNLCFVSVQLGFLPLLPAMYARFLPASLTWFSWLTLFTLSAFVLYKIALAARWLWRIKYLTQPVYVEPTHWQDQFPFTRKRLLGRTVATIFVSLIALIGLIGTKFSPLFLGYYFAVPCMIISVIAGWKHHRGK